MLLVDSAFIGIDPTSSRKSFTYAVLDKDLNLLILAEGEMEDVAAFIAGQKSAIVAVNAPDGVNRGLVRKKMEKEMLVPHKNIRGAEFRLSEYKLRERGIAVSGTPSSVALSPAWIQMGFNLYHGLRKIGFKKYPGTESKYQMLETHPHACFCVMIGQSPLSKSSFEGRLQRQLVLYEHGVKIKDPMGFFEEITRFKMINGVWPMELLYLPEQLDALIAAYTAWIVAHKPDRVLSLGDVKEGFLVLPVKELKEKY